MQHTSRYAGRTGCMALGVGLRVWSVFEDLGMRLRVWGCGARLPDAPVCPGSLYKILCTSPYGEVPSLCNDVDVLL